MEISILIEKINKNNVLLKESFHGIENTPIAIEDSEKLVSQLHLYIDQRQKLISMLVSEKEFADRQFLQSQLQLTQDFEQQAIEIKKYQQSVLHSGLINKRKVNVYKTVNAN